MKTLKNRWDEFWHRQYIKWREYPAPKKKLVLYLGNYVVNAFFISWIYFFFLLYHIPLARVLLIIPVITVFLIYFEHYYKWLRIGYKDEYDKE